MFRGMDNSHEYCAFWADSMPDIPVLISMLYYLEKLSLECCPQVTFSPALGEGREPAELIVGGHHVSCFVVNFL